MGTLAIHTCFLLDGNQKRLWSERMRESREYDLPGEACRSLRTRLEKRLMWDKHAVTSDLNLLPEVNLQYESALRIQRNQKCAALGSFLISKARQAVPQRREMQRQAMGKEQMQTMPGRKILTTSSLN